MKKPIVADNLVLDGEAVRRADGEYRIESQCGFENYFASQKDGWRLPAVQEYITIFEELEQTNGPALEGILQDLWEGALCTATKIDYKNSNLPLGNGYLDQLAKDPAWRTALQDEVLQYDVGGAIAVLQKASGKRPYIWTPSAEGRKSYPERGVWVDTYTDRFILNCSDIDYCGRSRRVRGASVSELKAPQGAAHKNETIRIPEVPSITVPENVDYDQLAVNINDSAALEYATRLLNGIPSGTVMDWKKQDL